MMGVRGVRLHPFSAGCNEDMSNCQLVREHRASDESAAKFTRDEGNCSESDLHAATGCRHGRRDNTSRRACILSAKRVSFLKRRMRILDTLSDALPLTGC